ncbi:MAG: DUF3592 domain-containing protein [Candidatus Zixiibacteriota bacterium]|nr:MAG: DUF3592 domain-containing protein [candidate division Zixibacteria bacterium]
MRKAIIYSLYFLCAAGGAVLAAIEIETVLRGREMRTWPTVPGVVTESEVVGDRAIRPRVVYDYTVDGTIYRSESDLRVPMFGGRRKKYDVATKLVAKYPVGSQVTVYYQPDSVARSTIVPEVPWDVYGKLGLGVLLCLIGMTGLIQPALAIRRAPYVGPKYR